MTTLKTPEEVTETIRKALNLREELIDGTDEIAFVKNTITKDRQHTAQVLCDLLDKIKPEHQENENPHTGVSIDAVNTFLTKAQALIRQMLDPISNQE